MPRPTSQPSAQLAQVYGSTTRAHNPPCECNEAKRVDCPIKAHALGVIPNRLGVKVLTSGCSYRRVSSYTIGTPRPMGATRLDPIGEEEEEEKEERDAKEQHPP